MTIDVRPAEDPERYYETDQLVWFDEPTDIGLEKLLASVPAGERFAARTEADPEDAYAGIYGVRPMELGIPGDRVPVAGLTWVGVHPDARRRGVLSAMMRDHFTRSRAAGRFLSVLHASEPGIYGRFGYGLAALELAVDLSRGATLTAPGLEEQAGTLEVRLGPRGNRGVPARMRAVDLALATRVPGMIVGEEIFYDRLVHEFPHELRDKEPMRVLFARRSTRSGAGEEVGYAAFRRTHKWDNARPGGEVALGMLHGDPATRLALLRRVLDLDLMGSIKLARCSPDDAVLTWAGGPRATSDVRTYDSTWVRLVDLPAAWAARAYGRDCDVVVRVEDSCADWNSGTWRLGVREGRGVAERVDEQPDMTLDANVLGAGYLGRSVAPLLPAGWVREHRAGAFTELAETMRTPVEPAPSMGF